MAIDQDLMATMHLSLLVQCWLLLPLPSHEGNKLLLNPLCLVKCLPVPTCCGTIRFGTSVSNSKSRIVFSLFVLELSLPKRKAGLLELNFRFGT